MNALMLLFVVVKTPLKLRMTVEIVCSHIHVVYGYILSFFLSSMNPISCLRYRDFLLLMFLLEQKLSNAIK